MTALELLLAFALAVLAWWLLAVAADTLLGVRIAGVVVDAVRTAPGRVTAWAWTAWNRARIRL